MDEPRVTRWQPLALLGGAILLAGAVLGGLLLLRRPAPAPAPAAVAPAPPEAPTPPPPTVPPVPPAPPATREISWAGLSVAPYGGALRGEYAAQRVVATLEQDLLDAVKDLKDAAGLYPTAEDRVVFEPVDAAECSFRGPYGLVVSPSGDTYRVQVPLEPLLLNWYPARRLFASALAEAVLTRAAPGYASSPAWLRHGMALYLSRFGEFVERRALLASEVPPIQLVRPLGDAGEQAWVVGYWAFRSMGGRRGDAAVTELADALRFTGDWSTAMAEAGEGPGQMEAAYRTWATAHLRGTCANREEFLDMVGLLRREEESRALPRLEEFLRERPLDLYAGDAKYYCGYALYRTGDYDRAVRTFTDLLHNEPYRTSLQAKAHFFLGRCYQLLNYPPLAYEQYLLASAEPSSALLTQMAQSRMEEVR